MELALMTGHGKTVIKSLREEFQEMNTIRGHCPHCALPIVVKGKLFIGSPTKDSHVVQENTSQ